MQWHKQLEPGSLLHRIYLPGGFMCLHILIETKVKEICMLTRYYLIF